MSNREGYPDPTAEIAIANVMIEQKRKEQQKQRKKGTKPNLTKQGRKKKP